MVCFDVMPLIVGALLEERYFWRIAAACQITSLIAAIEGSGRMHRRPIVAKSALRQELAETVENLRAASEFDLFPACEACGDPVRPGDATILDVECGEMHAECFGQDGKPPIRPGDKVYVDPESIVVGEGEEKPDHLIAGEACRLYTDEQIADRLERGIAWLNAQRAA